MCDLSRAARSPYGAASLEWRSEVGFEPLLSLAKEPALPTEGPVPESSNGAVSKMPSPRGDQGFESLPLHR
jgi:hypothetical protein